MEHWRVTKEGKLLGRVTAKLVEAGSKFTAAFSTVEFPNIRKEMCVSCAGRPGTVPNGCIVTQFDFLKTVVDGIRFNCHAPLDGRMCAAWIQARAAHVVKPIPQEIQVMLARVEYSKDNEE